ncbi:MAG: class I SAM-dependent methyltransferase [Stackebrandtia sp.]
MDEIVNTHQYEAWNGYEGRHWAENSERMDAVNDAVNDALFAAANIRGGERVLDIGCGNGKTTRIAARAAEPGAVTGIDLSGPMLARARELATAESLDNVDLIQADAQVYPFSPASFDVAISRAGVMFFGDAHAGFGNIASALKPDGRLAFVSLQDLRGDPETLAVVFDAIAAHVPPPPPAEGPGPLSLSNPDTITETLRGAGFASITVDALERPSRLGRDAVDAAEFLTAWGPIAHWLKHGNLDAVADAHVAVTEALRPFETQDGVRLKGRSWLVTASRS